MKVLTKYLFEKRVLEDDTLYWIIQHQKWCEAYGTTPETIKFNEVIVCVEDLFLEHQDDIMVNIILRQIRWYYQYLFEHKKIKRNLFDDKYLKKETKRIFLQITVLKTKI